MINPMALNTNDELLLKGVYQRLADKPLEPDDPYYERIYARLEGEDPVAKLRKCIEWTTVESMQLFSGFRGTGKTTELFRLRRDLEQKGYLVLYANALDYLSSSEEVDIVTMLLSVAGAFGEQLDEQLQEVSGGKMLTESFYQRIVHYLKTTTIEATEVSAKIEPGILTKKVLGDINAGVDIKAALKTAPSFRQRLQDFLSNRLGELKTQVNAFVEEGVKRIRETKKVPELPIVLLFDQFEQVRGSRSTEQAVIQSIEQLFANHLEMLKLPLVHVIYTVPPWLQFVLPGAFSIETLPCVRLWKNDPERTPYEKGRSLLLDAVIKRFGRENFEQVFGKTPQGTALADDFVAFSGGHFRDLLRLFRETILLISTWRPSLPVKPEVLDRAITNVRNEFLPIAIEDALWLEKIAVQRDTALPDSKPENIGRLSRFLDTHLVLYLTNGKDWYDLHPLIRGVVGNLAKPPAPEKG
jgi:hypothetical protein